VELVIRQAHHHHKETGAETTQAVQVMCHIDPAAAVVQVVKAVT
jgi:hypothetical protein